MEGEVLTTRLPGKSLVSFFRYCFLNLLDYACILAVVFEWSSKFREINRAVENINIVRDVDWKKKSTA